MIKKSLAKRFGQNLIMLLLYYSLLGVVAYYLIIHSTFNHTLEHGFLTFDAVHFYRIKEYGYNAFYWYAELLAFFPFFPILWKMLDISKFHMSMVNGLIFITSLSYLTARFNFKWKQIFIGACFPSLIFFFVPYSEAVFFLSGTVVLAGYYYKNRWVIALGLFMASLARPAVTILLPALILTEIICSDNRRQSIMDILLFSSAIVAGILIVFTLHYYATGNFFAYFTAFETWDNNFKFPIFPLTSWGGTPIIILDGFSLLFGIAGIGIVLNWLIARFKKKKVIVSKAVVFSSLYVAGVAALIILLMRAGYLFSLNRLIFATPFFFLLLLYMLKRYKFRVIHLLYFFIGLQAYWLLFGSYRHIGFLFDLLLGSLLFLLAPAVLVKEKRVRQVAFFLLVISGATLQVIFYLRIIGREWVG